MPFRASADGEAIVYAAEAGASTGNGEVGPGLGNSWLATRTASGWRTQDISEPGNVFTGIGVYESFSSDLATGFYENLGPTILAPGVDPRCHALYTRASADGSFTPLFTNSQQPGDCGLPLFAGADANKDTFIFQSEAALTPGAEEATEVPPGHFGERGLRQVGSSCGFGCNLYESVGGQVQAVNALEGKPVPNATFGGYGLNKYEAPNFSNAISSDGSRIFWTDTQPGLDRVYVFENGTSNVPVSGSEPAVYWGATSDGHYAFYTESGRLWRFDTFANNAPQPLTPEHGEVQGVLGINQTGEPGGYVYFVARGVLSGAPNTHGERAASGGFNLYLLHGGGAITFIAGLSSVDNTLLTSTTSSVRGGDWSTGLGERTAQVTSDGRNLVFESMNHLTGYTSGYEQPEVFVYSADNEQLACASCNPSGEPLEQGLSVSANEESKVPASAMSETYMERWISQDGGRVFFDAPGALTPDVHSQAIHVYEWERPAGPGDANNSCTAAQASPVTGGCTYLLSGGTGSTGSFLIDSDLEGNNVFFEHFGQLGPLAAPADHLLLYDARVGGGISHSPVGCGGAACAPAGSSQPAPGEPSTATFAGAGNLPSPAPSTSPSSHSRTSVKSTTKQKLARALRACRKLKMKSRRQRCERRARRTYAGKTAQRGSARNVRNDTGVRR